MKKIIFLDVDGVLNSNFWNDSHQRELSDGTLIDKDKVILLGELVKNTGAKIVLHSGWRFWFDDKMEPLRIESAKLAEMLQECGMKIFDVTPDLATEEIIRTKKFSLVKANEILRWLALHEGVDKWIVIDDLDLHNELILQHQIKPNQTVGLTKQDIEKAEKMLLADRQMECKER